MMMMMKRDLRVSMMRLFHGMWTMMMMIEKDFYLIDVLNEKKVQNEFVLMNNESIDPIEIEWRNVLKKNFEEISFDEDNPSFHCFQSFEENSVRTREFSRRFLHKNFEYPHNNIHQLNVLFQLVSTELNMDENDHLEQINKE